jgi:3-deoxy-D-manno-octulosonic-acid transferase
MALKSKYRHSVPARFFMLKNSKFPKDENSIWFHACSLGETIALQPLLKELDAFNPSISVTTQTGFDAGKKMLDKVRFLPFEAWLPFWVTKQKTLVVLEAELWYMLFLMAKSKGTKTALLNARISDRSYKSYLKMTWFYKRLFAYVDRVFCQSEIDRDRLLALGAKNVEVIGNIKLANTVTATKELSKPEGLFIVGASTHESEEALILDAYASYLKERKKPSRLVMVPRHPERFKEVSKLMHTFASEHELSYHEYSQKDNFESDLVLVDTLGELINIYAISDVVILGGGFAPIGGHNPLEPATFNNKIISGEAFFNQKGLFPLVNNIKIVENDGLTEALQNIDAQEIASIEGSVDLTPFYDWINQD